MEVFNKFKEYFDRQLTLIKKKQDFFLENLKKGLFKVEDFGRLGFMDFSLAFDKSNEVFFKTREFIDPKEVPLADLKPLIVDKDIKDCMTESINNQFIWGKYGEFKIIICKKNGYINGTFLFNEAIKYENTIRIKNNKGQTSVRINNWLDNDTTIELFESASEDEGISFKELSFSVSGKQKKGEQMLQGTYFHPILINSLAMWISPKYALKVNKIMNSVQAKTERDRVSQLLDKKDDIISRLEKMVNDTATRFEISVKNNEIQINKLSKIVGYTESVAKEIRLNTTNENTHTIFIYKFTNTETADIFYKCYRLHNKSLSTIKKEKRKYMSLQFICIFSEKCVNSIQTWNKIKDENKNIIVDKDSKSGTKFTLKKNYNDFMLVEDTYFIMNERVREIASLN